MDDEKESFNTTVNPDEESTAANICILKQTSQDVQNPRDVFTNIPVFGSRPHMAATQQYHDQCSSLEGFDKLAVLGVVIDLAENPSQHSLGSTSMRQPLVARLPIKIEDLRNLWVQLQQEPWVPRNTGSAGRS